MDLRNRGVAAIASLVSLSSCAASTRPRPIPERTVAGASHVAFPSRDGDLTHTGATRVDGWLFRPPGVGPFPAVIALHGCAGLYGKGGDLAPRHRDWAERLVKLGFVVLLPDSFSPRGVDEICSRKPQPVRSGYERPRDAYGALQYVQGLPFVRPEAVALLGWSNGGMTVLSAMAANTHARPPGLAHDFHLAIAFYPGCGPTLDRSDWAPPVAPVHILIGEKDDWTPAAECSELVQRVQATGGPVDLIVYPDAFHDFDDPVMPVHVRQNVASTASGRATIGKNPAARADAIERVSRLLLGSAQAVPGANYPASP
jgi:dienelactone hydrolase